VLREGRTSLCWAFLGFGFWGFCILCCLLLWVKFFGLWGGCVSVVYPEKGGRCFVWIVVGLLGVCCSCLTLRTTTPRGPAPGSFRDSAWDSG